ncbi:GAF domain-containing sensor histidine kinase [Saccharopolyspora sp. 5N708]|uniref:GAF domain-containing sensor histidine kinase n=1 Tax=Saccharopolyspora sp. 5N708 TaxID=3457424 RepID=UPI003FD04B5A
MSERATAGEQRQPSTPDCCPTCGQPTGGGAAKADGTGGDARHEQRRLAAIARAASSVADAGSLSVTLDVVAREVVQAEHIAAAQILRVEHDAMQILGKAGFTDAEDFLDRLEECRKLGARMMFVEAFRTGRRIVVPHRKKAILDDPTWAPLHAIMGAPEWDSFVAVPLVVRGRAVGVLNAYYEPGEIPGASALEFLEAMADQAATAVDSADLLVRSRRDAQLDERARLARELHDSVVQHVFSMRMQAKALRAQVEPGRTSSPERVRAVADELLGLAQHALADLRGLVLQLHPTELVGRGLVAAVREHAESVQAATGLTVEVVIDEPWLIPELPTELQEDLYRIVQEALHNVVKHACANRAVVRINTVDGSGRDHLLVEISDDGKGWQPKQERRGGLGLVSMTERAQRWGGHMEIDNADRGCRVRVRLPAAHGGGR